MPVRLASVSIFVRYAIGSANSASVGVNVGASSIAASVVSERFWATSCVRVVVRRRQFGAFARASTRFGRARRRGIVFAVDARAYLA